MKYANKLMLTESQVYELGKNLNKKRGKKITEIKVTYPIAKIYVNNLAKPAETVFLQNGSEIDWLDKDD